MEALQLIERRSEGAGAGDGWVAWTHGCNSKANGWIAIGNQIRDEKMRDGAAFRTEKPERQFVLDVL